MRMMFVAALLCAGGSAAHAAPAPAACAALDDAALPRELSGFDGHAPVVASGAALAVDNAVLLQLVPPPMAGFAVPVAPHPVANPWAGTVRLTIDLPGVYRVALGATAWIDMVRASGEVLASVAHTPGPRCSGVRKIVDFALREGEYVLRLSNSPAERLTVMVVPQP